MKEQGVDCIKSFRIHAFSALILLLMMAGCDNVTSPDTTTSVQKAEQSLETADAISTISDGVHGGTEGFYFLPPMVNDPAWDGTFDPALQPVVDICTTATCDVLHASYSMTEGNGSEAVRLDEENEHYIVNWNTSETEATAGQTYRVRVSVAGTVLGYADVAVVSTGREAVEIRSDGSIALITNQTLPVKFRIETGIVGAVVVTPAEASINVGATQQFSAELFNLSGEPLSGPTVMWSSDDKAIADVDANGLATGKSAGQAVITAASGPATGSAFLSVTSDSKFFLADNGVTIQCPTAAVGEKGSVDGVEYEAVDNALLRTRKNDGADLTILCTTPVTDMSVLFRDDADFNQNISGWDTANVTNMANMFNSARSFNQPIGGWNTASVTTMGGMFRFASAFNQDISGWDTANVTSMVVMFNEATAFNQPIGGWNTASVKNMNFMFLRANAFNQDISGWNTANVTDMSGMFAFASAFNQDIGGWNTANVTNMLNMFRFASAFNQDIGGWDTGKVSDMRFMFYYASSFNRDLSGWCVSLILAEPDGFDTGATGWVLENSRPIWGTCPI